MTEADIANAAVKYAAETGRLDFLSAALAILTIVLGLSAFPMFFFLKWRAEAVAREAAEGILRSAQERMEQLAISRMEQMLPTLVNEYAELAANAVDGGVADKLRRLRRADMTGTIINAIRKAQRVAPVDVVGLAEELGLRVNFSFLDPGVSGELRRVSEDSYEINVNARDPETRQRFTIAHELGHFINHRDLIGDGVDDDRAYRSTSVGRYHNTRIGPKQETEANKFAASLLMPRDIISELKGDGLSRSQMAKRLGVSEHALAIRTGDQYP